MKIVQNVYKKDMAIMTALDSSRFERQSFSTGKMSMYTDGYLSITVPTKYLIK